MLKKLGIPTLALTIAIAVAAPAVTLARGRDDQRGGGEARHEVFRGREGRDDRGWRDRDDRRFNFGVGVYTAPAPAPAGYYDQFGIWHPYVYGPYGRYR